MMKVYVVHTKQCDRCGGCHLVVFAEKETAEAYAESESNWDRCSGGIVSVVEKTVIKRVE